ncbi:phosphatidylserine/phosphatidylglycerophosphate/cardiolipin synthase family protein [Vogesella sp. LIG4]|uniref:phospholipase D-like domain-containing protein n=1 Tax=Vogesella sp. LIG4 TaxID=1192162 RepID=UPI00081FB2AB|nr:phosphatidylserine/phosphatidylglycerophosphate/cardiolipin synthase family protein [Vogesella sp. LIG4]SCK25428.1 PLD-like domain-containing protein [Vogesella sp. LIG4]
MSDKAIVSPVSTQDRMKAHLTLPWFLQKSEYYPHPASFQVLVNGEDAFAAVHLAIAKAKKNVCIICWGFQPSMYFVRKGADKVKYAEIAEAVPAQIGKLLEYKAKQGVQVRVLSFASKPGNLYVNSTGATVEESQTPGRWSVGVKDRPDFETDAQYGYDKQWYAHFDEDQPAAGSAEKSTRDQLHPEIPSKNLHFRSRGFGPRTRSQILNQDYTDKGLATTTKATLAAGPSHHQKMVLVDYDDPAGHVGFVMGHNMLDEYWDTNKHSAKRKAPNLGRNGTVGPREDFSSLLTGPMVGDMFHNFRRAWRDETKEDLPLPACGFTSYQPRTDGKANKAAMVQLLRTQPEYQKQDIKKLYLQAVNNITSYIYIENQYFRWPPLAEKIKEVAKAQKEGGRPFPVYLFVVTNSSDAGVGKGTDNTYRMLDSLGRADTIPGIARDARADDLEARLGQAKQAEREAAIIHATTILSPAKLREKSRQALEEATARRQQAEKAYEAAQKPDTPITAVEQPGLKTHICTLVAMDSPPGAWAEVYIHAKLMLVNDAFLTLGSANINTRSMQVDSELNVALDRPEITLPLRQTLWGRHTQHREGANPARMDKELDAKMAFEKWRNILNDNKACLTNSLPPVAPLREFLRTDPARSYSD